MEQKVISNPGSVAGV